MQIVQHSWAGVEWRDFILKGLIKSSRINDHNSNSYQREIALLILYQFMKAGQMRACAKSGIVLLMSDVIF